MKNLTFFEFSASNQAILYPKERVGQVKKWLADHLRPEKGKEFYTNVDLVLMGIFDGHKENDKGLWPAYPFFRHIGYHSTQQHESLRPRSARHFMY